MNNSELDIEGKEYIQLFEMSVKGLHDLFRDFDFVPTGEYA